MTEIDVKRASTELKPDQSISAEQLSDEKAPDTPVTSEIQDADSNDDDQKSTSSLGENQGGDIHGNDDDDEDPLEEIPESEKNLEKSMELKAKANDHFSQQSFDDAIEQYELALKYCPSIEEKSKAILYSNLSICYLRKSDYESVIEYTTHAIKLDPTFKKPYQNRVTAYEKTEKLEEALEDLRELEKMEPNNKEIKTRIFVMTKDLEKLNEKRKTEVLSGLKSLGNTILGKFGLSLDNFKLNQNEGGSYNIQFQK